MEKPKCQDCMYFEEKYEQCRRFPPQVWTNEIQIKESFPSVELDDWCGEFNGGLGLNKKGERCE